MASWKTTVSMDSEKQSKCRILVPCLVFITLILFVYTVSSTIYIVLQSQTIDSLEKFTMRLSDRVDKIETKLAAQAKKIQSVGGELSDVENQTGSKLTGNQSKASPVEDKPRTNARNKRQFPQGVCPCVKGKRGRKGRKGKRGRKGPPGPKGAPGPKGDQGLPGEKGAPGPKGPEGPRGFSGVNGRHGRDGREGVQGPPGPHGKGGPQGPQGNGGPQGPIGKDGPQGLKGEPGSIGPAGRNGSAGPKGDQGARGPPGPVMSESIHLVGDDTTIKHPGVTFVHWRQGHRSGSIQYLPQTGYIEVKKAGVYFIYSQIYYYADTLLLGHYTYVNNKKVLESVASPQGRRYNTKFHGGVFQLNVRDRISVRPMFVNEYRLDRHGSYFGAFMLYPTS